ncbi:MAG: N-methyl-D-aspartate receptor NMDAR2C subunit [Candidatus Liptonbacteria bacterium]|nr:N-methyl-D-aspartate receptor NMDAR2C subunit [Candidatus Liptonbacteria bacterium]
MPNQAKQLWLRLWRRIGAKGNPSNAYDDLATRYSESHRAYHTLEHIVNCLDEFEQVQHLVGNPNAVEFALWYHDAIYNTKAKDNEEKSAELAVGAAKRTSLPGNLGQSAANLILATKHAEIPADPDSRFLVDIDLSILGQSEDRFDEYERQIRKEYAWVPEDAFVSGRGAILKSFLGRPSIYSTEFFRNKYEAQARLNIARSIARLSGN